ncbi:MAG: GtrA family protein [Hyphomicrobiaceae bacterium]
MMETFQKLMGIPLLRFLAVGVAATVAHFTVLIMLVELAHVPAIAASVLSYACGAVVNYALNRSFTFRSQTEHRTAVPRFALMVTMGLTLNTTIFSLLHMLGFHYILAQAITTLVVVMFNYTVASRWVFAGPTRIDNEP